MNYKQIVQFLTICKYMNLSAAAKELFISQPALSLSLSRMEELLDVQLFYRDSNKLILTEDGEKLKSDFQQLNDDFETLFKNASTLNSQHPDVIKIAFAAPVSLYMAICTDPSLASFMDKTIQKMHINFSQATEMLKTNQIDFAITTPALNDPLISNHTIFTESFFLCVSSGHKLAKKKKVTLRDLENIEFVCLGKQHKFRLEIDRILGNHNFIPNYAIECDYEEYNQIVLENAGSSRFAGFCSNIAFDYIFPEGYVMIPIDIPDMFRTYSISWLSESKIPFTHKQLFEQLEHDFLKYVHRQKRIFTLYHFH